MRESDPYINWSISNRLQMFAFEAELAHLKLADYIITMLRELRALG
jgi:hypothetical protein